jgi:hypothetical protein
MASITKWLIISIDLKYFFGSYGFIVKRSSLGACEAIQDLGTLPIDCFAGPQRRKKTA